MPKIVKKSTKKEIVEKPGKKLIKKLKDKFTAKDLVEFEMGALGSIKELMGVFDRSPVINKEKFREIISSHNVGVPPKCYDSAVDELKNFLEDNLLISEKQFLEILLSNKVTFNLRSPKVALKEIMNILSPTNPVTKEQFLKIISSNDC